jgi:hypothetical protein
MFWPRANSPLSIEAPSAKGSPALISWPFLTIGCWLIEVEVLERINFKEWIFFLFAVLFEMTTRSEVTDATHSIGFGNQNLARIISGFAFDTGTDTGSFGLDTRHGLTLHVRSHQGAVGIIVFQKWNQRCRDRNNLLWGNFDKLISSVSAIDGSPWTRTEVRSSTKYPSGSILVVAWPITTACSS